MADYAHSEVLVSTEWVADNLNAPTVVIAEVDVEPELYDRGHVPGAIGWNWQTQLCDTLRRDIISKDAFEQLMRQSGIEEQTTVVLYGDSNNWFAAWAFWQMKVYGHKDVRLMDGGRKKWEREGRRMTPVVPRTRRTRYRAQRPDASLRAFLPEVMDRIETEGADLVDVRSPQEYSGKILAPPGLPETCQRGGHIPGAANVPWSEAINEDDGTFKPSDQLRDLYKARGITGEKPIITYCRIGERSSHSWFALRYLLGYKDVKNYDGSWTEWGNLVGAPVERSGWSTF